MNYTINVKGKEYKAENIRISYGLGPAPWIFGRVNGRYISAKVGPVGTPDGLFGTRVIKFTQCSTPEFEQDSIIAEYDRGWVVEPYFIEKLTPEVKQEFKHLCLALGKLLDTIQEKESKNAA